MCAGIFHIPSSLRFSLLCTKGSMCSWSSKSPSRLASCGSHGSTRISSYRCASCRYPVPMLPFWQQVSRTVCRNLRLAILLGAECSKISLIRKVGSSTQYPIPASGIDPVFDSTHGPLFGLAPRTRRGPRDGNIMIQCTPRRILNSGCYRDTNDVSGQEGLWKEGPCLATYAMYVCIYGCMRKAHLARILATKPCQTYG